MGGWVGGWKVCFCCLLLGGRRVGGWERYLPVMVASINPQMRLMEREASKRLLILCILTSCCRWNWPVRVEGGWSCRRIVWREGCTELCCMGGWVGGG